MITILGIFLELDIFQTKVVEKIEKNIWRLWDNVEKHSKARQAKYNKITLRKKRTICIPRQE